MFYVKGNENVALRKHCLMCNMERFTQEEIQILSNNDLIPEEFNKSDFRTTYPIVCNHCGHRNEEAIRILIEKDYIITQQIGNYARYIFGQIWVIEFKATDNSITSRKSR